MESAQEEISDYKITEESKIIFGMTRNIDQKYYNNFDKGVRKSSILKGITIM